MNVDNEIINILGKKSYNDALNIGESDIYLESTRKILYGEIYFYYVYDYIAYSYQSLSIRMTNRELSGFGCSCSEFRMRRSCKHIAAVLRHNSEIFFPKPLTVEDITKTLLDEFKQDKKEKFSVKEPLKFIIELDLEYTPTFKIHVGLKKTYQLNTEAKLRTFIDKYENGGTYLLGKEFTFDSNKHYLTSEDKCIFDILKTYGKNYYTHSNIFELNDRELKYLLEKLQGKEFKLKNIGIVNNIIYDFPTEINLNKIDNKYHLNILNLDKYRIIDDDLKYIYYNKTLYVIPQNYRKILKTLYENKIGELVFTKDNVDLFKNGMLKSIQNNINISDNVTDIVVSLKPKASLYFDLNKSFSSLLFVSFLFCQPHMYNSFSALVIQF